MTRRLSDENLTLTVAFNNHVLIRDVNACSANALAQHAEVLGHDGVRPAYEVARARSQHVVVHAVEEDDLLVLVRNVTVAERSDGALHPLQRRDGHLTNWLGWANVGRGCFAKLGALGRNLASVTSGSVIPGSERG